MGERIGQTVSLDDRVVEAKQSEPETTRLLEEFMPFLDARVAKYSSPAESDKRDKLQSVAMMAFYEAIQKYDRQKGHFFPFANRVIRARFFDTLRQMYKNGESTVSLDAGDDTQPNPQSAAINRISIQVYEAGRRQEMLVEEIEQFKGELNAWGITLETLTRSSPKQRKLLETYRMIVAKIAQNLGVIETIWLKHYFPVKIVAELTGLPQKNVERARTFILASLIIKLGDYDYLSEYVNYGEGGA